MELISILIKERVKELFVEIDLQNLFFFSISVSKSYKQLAT